MTAKQNFTPHTIIDHIASVTDVRAADFNGDGRLDLVVGQFGYDDGETRWMENLGNWQFRSHILQSLSGVIHTIPVDIDNDGDMDFVSLVSQEWEETLRLRKRWTRKFQIAPGLGQHQRRLRQQRHPAGRSEPGRTGGHPAHQRGCL